jgi:hypothetical protein
MVSFTPQPLYAWENGPPVTHWIGRWVGPRAGLDAVMNGKNPTISPARNGCKRNYITFRLHLFAVAKLERLYKMAIKFTCN